MWYTFQSTSKDWIDGSVEGSCILAALLQQQWRVSCTWVGSADPFSVKVWDTRGPSYNYRKAYFVFGWRLLEKDTLFAWAINERCSCSIHKFVPFMGRCITFPHPQLWVGSWALLLYLCSELLGAGLTAATLCCRATSRGKHSCNHSQVSDRALVCLKGERDLIWSSGSSFLEW